MGIKENFGILILRKLQSDLYVTTWQSTDTICHIAISKNALKNCSLVDRGKLGSLVLLPAAFLLKYFTEV